MQELIAMQQKGTNHTERDQELIYDAFLEVAGTSYSISLEIKNPLPEISLPFTVSIFSDVMESDDMATWIPAIVSGGKAQRVIQLRPQQQFKPG